MRMLNKLSPKGDAAVRRREQLYLPASVSAQPLVAELKRALQRCSDTSQVAERVMGSSKRARFTKLFAFLCKLVGSTQQRTLLAIATGLNFVKEVLSSMETHYAGSLLVQSVTTVAAAATTGGLRSGAKALIGRRGGGGGGNGGKGPVLQDVLLVMLMLKMFHSLLDSLHASVREAGSSSVRAMLSARLSRHVLSQDLEDIDLLTQASNPYSMGSATSPVSIIRSLSTPEAWEQGIGGILEIPQHMVASFARLVTSASILCGKSPKLVLMVYVVNLLQQVAMERWTLLIQSANEALGLDRPVK